ncbi:MAG TPA: DUF3788 family protein [Candidatus Polarisedimenticolaceae bacterium]|nr:DUF3788 family protein [Candidatus Polarisedimenticolaceae bacterium]
MPLSCFDAKEHPPRSSEVERALGPAASLWKQLLVEMEERYPPTQAVWHHAGKSFGWSLRVKRGERIVLYMTPQQGRFVVGVVLGEKAVDAAERGALPADVRELLRRAPRNAEGRGLRLPVTGRAELDAVCALAAAKMGSA